MKNKAKREAIDTFRKMMGKMGHSPMKATVIAKDEEGLKAGLEKAEEVMESRMKEKKDLDSMDAKELREYIRKNMREESDE